MPSSVEIFPGWTPKRRVFPAGTRTHEFRVTVTEAEMNLLASRSIEADNASLSDLLVTALLSPGARMSDAVAKQLISQLIAARNDLGKAVVSVNKAVAAAADPEALEDRLVAVLLEIRATSDRLFNVTEDVGSA